MKDIRINPLFSLLSLQLYQEQNHYNKLLLQTHLLKQLKQIGNLICRNSTKYGKNICSMPILSNRLFLYLHTIKGKKHMIENLREKNTQLAVIGLGYVGLPLALEFAKKYSVIGFDINQSRVESLQQHTDPSEDVDEKSFENTDILFTSQHKDLQDATVYIVAVPTPIDAYNIPDLQPLISATKSVAKVLKK